MDARRRGQDVGQGVQGEVEWVDLMHLLAVPDAAVAESDDP